MLMLLKKLYMYKQNLLESCYPTNPSKSPYILIFGILFLVTFENTNKKQNVIMYSQTSSYIHLHNANGQSRETRVFTISTSII